MMRIGPVDLLSLEEVYDVQHHALKTSAKFRLNDSLKVRHVWIKSEINGFI